METFLKSNAASISSITYSGVGLKWCSTNNSASEIKRLLAATKVTNVLPTLTGSGELKILVNGNDIVVAFSKGTYGSQGSSSGFNNDYHYNGLQGAYWLPEGTTLQSSDNVQYISVIEFNEWSIWKRYFYLLLYYFL